MPESASSSFPSLRVLITGGKTGGHIYPALAVAEALKNKEALSAEILFVGNVDGMETRLVPERGITFRGIRFSGLPRGKLSLQLLIKLFQWPFLLVQAVMASQSVLKSFRPDVVFATGGYVTAPVLMAANLAGIPTVIHEPDACPGLVNRLMSRWANRMTGAFEASRNSLACKAFTVTGNPIRATIGRLNRQQGLERLSLTLPPWHQADSRIVVVMGGSQGARQINMALVQALPTFLETMGFCIYHQTGETLYPETLQALPPAFHHHPQYLVKPFIQHMDAVLAIADLVICRAGSLSLSELYAAGLPSVLIPYPFAAANHQEKNARASVAAGASVLLPDKDCSPETLISCVQSLFQIQPGLPEPPLSMMGHQAQGLAHPNATEKIVDIILTQAKSSHSSKKTL